MKTSVSSPDSTVAMSASRGARMTVFSVAASGRRAPFDIAAIVALLVALAIAFVALTVQRIHAEAAAARLARAQDAVLTRQLVGDVVANLYREQAATRAAIVLRRAVDRDDVRAARAAVRTGLDRLSERAATRPALERRLAGVRPEIVALEATFDRELRFVARGEGARARAWFARDRVFAAWLVDALNEA